MLKRFFLFGLMNIAVIVLASTVLSIFGVTPYLTSKGLNIESLFFFALIFGFTGSFFSLLISKYMAKTIYGIRIITEPANQEEKWLVDTVAKYARQMQIGMPEVGIYNSPEVNAFATGAGKNSSLVAFSTGILHRMNRDEVEGVIGHEIAHIANGDMVTMTLIQGVLNTFVIFFARLAAYAVASMTRRGDSENSNVSPLVFSLVSFVFEIAFGIIAQVIACWFSRQREFRADSDSARFAGKAKMIAALRRLQENAERTDEETAPQLAAFKISSRKSFLNLFTTHPPLEERIRRLSESI